MKNIISKSLSGTASALTIFAASAVFAQQTPTPPSAVAGMGHANVAASTMALALDPRFDLKKTYFLIAGIAEIDPAQGTTGTAAWGRYLVDAGIAHEIDAREMPKNWKAGYLGLMTKALGEKPKF